MAGLIDYEVERDNFEFSSEYRHFSFPCVVCKHRGKKDSAPPCNKCDHNVNAEPIGDED